MLFAFAFDTLHFHLTLLLVCRCPPGGGQVKVIRATSALDEHGYRKRTVVVEEDHFGAILAPDPIAVLRKNLCCCVKSIK